MTQIPLEPERHEHSVGYDRDVPDVDMLDPDYDAEETDEADEVLEDEEATDE
jgi:hypothetical protein